MKNKIVVIGSSNVDMVMKMDHLPARGETVTDAEFIQVYGGKGANQAVGAARAGGDVAFVNCVGDDAFAPLMVENFKRDGINTDYIFHEKGISSGTALIMIGDSGNNYLSVAPGANYRLTPEYIDQCEDLMAGAEIIILQYEIPAETLAHVIKKAGDMTSRVLWNFAPARDIDPSLLPMVDILVVNEVEAAFLTGQSVTNREEIEAAANTLKAKGIDTVIITLGAEGSYVVSDN
ncbi:MAG TPA: ribokinase, partial [Bacteroidales bacterium]|nr:ribokinase [Bacteroidales bacterium]